jgi:hypothetical protein
MAVNGVKILIKIASARTVRCLAEAFAKGGNSDEHNEQSR